MHEQIVAQFEIDGRTVLVDPTIHAVAITLFGEDGAAKNEFGSRTDARVGTLLLDADPEAGAKFLEKRGHLILTQ